MFVGRKVCVCVKTGIGDAVAAFVGVRMGVFVLRGTVAVAVGAAFVDGIFVSKTWVSSASNLITGGRIVAV